MATGSLRKQGSIQEGFGRSCEGVKKTWAELRRPGRIKRVLGVRVN